MAFATGKVGGIQDCSWHTGQWGFTVAQRPVSECCPRQEASKYLRYRSGKWPRSVTPWDLYKQQWGPEPGGTKLKAQSRDQKSGKGLLWTVARPERASVGEGTKPKTTKLMKALWVELNNQVIIQIFIVPLLLPADEKKENNRSSKRGWPKPLKYWCRNWTFLLEMWNCSHTELLCL